MKKPYFLLLAALLAAGCQSNDEPNTEEQLIVLSPQVSYPVSGNDFSNGDRMGIYMVELTANGSNNLLYNAPYTYSQSGWTAPAGAYWFFADRSYDLYAYYPYNAALQDADLTAVPMTVPQDQSTESALRQADFLYGKRQEVKYMQGNSAVSVALQHMLCKLNITFDFDNENINLADATVQIRQVCDSAVVNMTTGDMKVINSRKNNITARFDNSTNTAQVYLLPQQLYEGKSFIYFYGTSSNISGYTLGQEINLVGGTEYNLTFSQGTADAAPRLSVISKQIR